MLWLESLNFTLGGRGMTMALEYRMRSLVAIVAALVIALVTGCGGPETKPVPKFGVPPAGQQRCNPADYSMGCALTTPAPSKLFQLVRPVARGIDFGWGGPSPSWMHSQGFRFGASYLSTDSAKNWQAAQVRAYAKAGIARVFVWETSATRALDGCAGGKSDALAALAQGAKFGFRALYFAVDFDMQPSQQGAVSEYFRCVHGQLGSFTGAYGGIAAMRLLFNLHLIHYGWQTYAWSGGRWDSRAQLQQYLNGNSYDLDRAVRKDYGQTPYAKPKPKPNPKLKRLYRERSHLRHILLTHHCRARRPRPKCRRELRRGARLNHRIRALGGR